MSPHRKIMTQIGWLTALAFLAACSTGPAVTGKFDRTFDVKEPLRLELTNASGDVDIRESADEKVHVYGDVRASGMGFDNPQKRMDETLANPPVEQKADVIRVGRDISQVRNVSIAYTIQVPHNTEVSTSVASGAQTIRGVRGPVRAQAASGSIRVEKIERDVQLNTASGSADAFDIGGDVHANSASGSVTVSNAKGDVRVTALAGVIQVTNPGGRVEAETASGSVEVQGAANDVRAHAVSGRVSVQGNPGPNSYWELKTVSGGVQLSVPAGANFQLSADAVSGEIRTDIPIVIEEQSKHSLRAHLGKGGGRVEVHTASGEIRVSSSK
jgi:DUF4097 and DUF4098 domain-containing protein YvlB